MVHLSSFKKKKKTKVVHLSQSNLLEQNIESHLQLHSHPLVLQNTCIKNKN